MGGGAVRGWSGGAVMVWSEGVEWRRWSGAGEGVVMGWNEGSCKILCHSSVYYTRDLIERDTHG